MKPQRDPGIENEPHLQRQYFEPQPGEAPMGTNIYTRDLDGTRNEDVDHSVWDEPALSGLAGDAPNSALTYRNWFEAKSQNWSQAQAWLVTFAVAGCLGPLWGLLSYLFSSMFNQFSGGTIYFVLFGPLIEEICKIAVPLWIVEKRPYYFTGWFQIFVCSMSSATLFAFVFLFFQWFGFGNLTISPVLIVGCFLMHTVTGFLASNGLEKVWRRAAFLKERPELANGAPWFLAAYGVHLVWSISIYFYGMTVNASFW